MPGILANTEVSQTFQIGLETSEGVAVAASKRIPDWEVVPGWGMTGKVYTPSTFKFPTIRVHGKEWSIFEISGPIGFASYVYIMSSAGNYVAPTGTTAKRWANTASISAVNTSKSYTMEWGNASAAYRAVNAHVVSYTTHWEFGEPTFKAQMIAKSIIPGITITPTPTTIENVPTKGAAIDIFSASSFAQLDGLPTWLGHVYVVDIDHGDIYGQEWPLKSINTSWDSRFEKKPKTAVKVTALEQISGSDYTGTPFTLAALRAGTVNYVRIKATGSSIATGGLEFAAVDQGGSGYVPTPTVTFTGGGGSGAVAVARHVGGVIAEYIVVEGGSGYTSAPTAALTGGGGTGAVPGTVTVASGKVTAVALGTAGSGFTFPTLAAGGGGTGATLAPVVSAGGVFTGVAVGTAGTGYSTAAGVSTVAITITGGGGTGATAYAWLDSNYSIIEDLALIPDESEPKRSFMDGLSVLEWPNQIGVNTTGEFARVTTAVNQVAAL